MFKKLKLEVFSIFLLINGYFICFHIRLDPISNVLKKADELISKVSHNLQHPCTQVVVRVGNTSIQKHYVHHIDWKVLQIFLIMLIDNVGNQEEIIYYLV